MITIIEGLDRCGKTTLISNLRKNYFKNPKLIVHHASSPPKVVKDSNAWEVEHYGELADTFHHLSAKEGYDILCDRFHLGAIVYGMKYRKLNPYTIYNLESNRITKGHEQKVALILLIDNVENIISRDDGLSLESSSKEFQDTHDQFIRVFGYSTIKHKLHINITDNGGFQNTLPTVTNFLDNIRGENAKSS
jgi:thymidylate kinase